MHPAFSGQAKRLGFARFLLAGAAMGAAVVFAEFILQAIARTGPSPSLATDPALGWDCLPAERSVGPQDGTPPILFLGDSFTQNNTWPERVAAALGRGGVNAGASGFGTNQQRLKLQRVLMEEQPCLVVLQFYAWNDLRDNWAWPALGYNPEMLARPYLSPEGNEFRPQYPWGWQDEFKLTAYFGKRSLVRAWQKADRAMRSKGVNLIAAERQTLVAGLCADEAWQPFYRPDQQGGAYVRGAWQVTEACLSEIRELCRQRKVPLLVLALDAPFTVDLDKWQYLSARHPELDRDLPMQRLQRFLKDQQISAVFFQENLRAWTLATRQSAYEGDAESLIGHLTPAAQEVIANQIVRVVENSIRLEPVRKKSGH